MIDIGVNLTNKSLVKDLDNVLQQAQHAGVFGMVITGTNIEESQKAAILCEKFPGYLFSTAGCHPHHADEFKGSDLNELSVLAKLEQVKAIGECGLDFNRNYSSKSSQLKAFELQLELAVELKLPVFLHQRDAHKTFCEILTDYRSELTRVVVHCFTDGVAEVQDYNELDCYIGITGWLCDERRNSELVGAVSAIPEERLLIETDAPYLLPRSLNPRPKSRTNYPKYLPEICQRLATQRNTTLKHMAEITHNNTVEFFNLKTVIKCQ